ncbi:MAG TPA: hypothetical protein DCS97_03460, partial [Planctomycetes bacterium]|nr:hypothetical protein [Planctomycetota bacterium]
MGDPEDAMRRILAVTLIAPAILAAAEQAKASPALLDRALTRGVTNDRPYRVSSRIEARYRAVRAVVARIEAQLMAGTATSAAPGEVASTQGALEADVAAVGLLTEAERNQYQESLRDLEALSGALAANGFGTLPVAAAPAAPAESSPWFFHRLMVHC